MVTLTPKLLCSKLLAVRSWFSSATAMAVLVMLAMIPSPGQAQTTTQATKAGKATGGHPDLGGIWEYMGTANWDLQDHPAEPGPMWQMGAIGAVPAGQSVVEGGDIPYLPAA